MPDAMELLREEIWKPVAGYEDRYEISSFGRFKRVKRLVIDSIGRRFTIKENISSLCLNGDGYHHVGLTDEFRKKKMVDIHVLVAKAFLPVVSGRKVINHKDGDKLNNRVENLEYVSVRENTTHGKSAKPSYTGCTLHRKSGRWVSRISVDGKKKHLGSFKTEAEASAAYKIALSEHGLENRYAR